MTDSFFRQSGADLDKRLDADLVTTADGEVYRQRVAAVQDGIWQVTQAGVWTLTGPLTDAELRATPVVVALDTSGLGGSAGNPLYVSGGASGGGASAVASGSPPNLEDGATADLSQTLNGELRVEESNTGLFLAAFENMLTELRVMNFILHTTLNCRDDLDELRRETFSDVRI
jgi:hypothetical protein